MVLVRRIARPMLASMFVAGGIDSLKHLDGATAAAEPVTEPVIEKLEPVVEQASPLPVHLDQRQLVVANAVVQVAAGSLLALGRASRLSALVLAGTLVPTTLAAHRFWEESDPSTRARQRTHFLKNVSMMGGLLLAAVDTEGRPGLAWWARRGVRRAADATTETAHRITPG